MPRISKFFDDSRRRPHHVLSRLFLSPILRYSDGKREYTMIKPGRYRHYKGGEYEVLGVAKHSETEEDFVVYRPLYGERGLWVRPKEMFAEMVVTEGGTVPRFRPLEESPI
jgi:hypothetical protein